MDNVFNFTSTTTTATTQSVGMSLVSAISNTMSLAVTKQTVSDQMQSAVTPGSAMLGDNVASVVVGVIGGLLSVALLAAIVVAVRRCRRRAEMPSSLPASECLTPNSSFHYDSVPRGKLSRADAGYGFGAIDSGIEATLKR
jgi:hypothetical protein